MAWALLIFVLAAWRRREEALILAREMARRLASSAVDLWDNAPFYPFKWVANWILLDLDLADGNLASAVSYAEAILEPAQQLMPEDVNAALEAVVQAWQKKENDAALTNLEKALTRAKTHHYL